MRLTRKLTAKYASALALDKGKREEIYWDPSLAGFGYHLRRRHPNGAIARRWVVQWRSADRRQHRLTLGKADVLDADRARAMARKCLGDACVERFVNGQNKRDIAERELKAELWQAIRRVEQLASRLVCTDDNAAMFRHDKADDGRARSFVRAWRAKHLGAAA